MTESEYTIYRAIAAGDTAFVTNYLSTGGDPNLFDPSGWGLLRCAVEYENKELIDLLLASGADMNYPSYGGWTALHQAVDLSIDGTIQSGGFPGDEPVDMIAYLLDRGADMHVKDSKGESPFDLALSYKSEKIIRFLKEYVPAQSE
ncbi:ankyrin repeat domain-containing protein [Paenibacillus wenxiniae]|uniref:Ankyrin repeat domain-containing protein n=1 Tax=Paenibacillus wenxiniae TaxID=1636843 RepID=A0ABW4RQX4_9BACL